MKEFPPELLEALSSILRPQGPGGYPLLKRVSVERVSAVLQCWLHGLVTTEQAVGLLLGSSQNAKVSVRPSR